MGRASYGHCSTGTYTPFQHGIPLRLIESTDYGVYMLTPPSQAEIDHWQKLVPDVKAPPDFLANESMLDYIASPAPRLHRSRRYKHMPISHARHCQRCGKPFLTKRPCAKWCSKLCRQRKPPLPEWLCEYCQQPLQPLRITARFHPECAQRAYRVKRAKIAR